MKNAYKVGLVSGPLNGTHAVRESSFSMTRAGMKTLKGAPKIFRHPKGGSEKIVGLGGGSPKICILQNQQEGEGAPK